MIPSILAFVAILFTGDFTINDYPIFPFVYILSFLISIRFGVAGSWQGLGQSSLISALLFCLLAISLLLNYLLNNTYPFTISYFLICLAPILGWSFVRLDRKINHCISNHKLNHFLIAVLSCQFFVSILAGPNISYRANIAALFIYINLLIFYINYWSVRRKIHLLLLIILSLSLTFMSNARGGLLILLPFTFLTLLPYLNLTRKNLFRVVSITVATISLLVLLYIIAVNAFPRLSTIGRILYLTDPESLMKLDSSSGSVYVRLQWYSYYFRPFDILNNVDLLGSINPPWGRYPHSILLDVLSNFGFLPFLACLYSIKVIISKYINPLFRRDHLFTSSFLISVLFSSFISGSAWDYHSIFLSLTLYSSKVYSNNHTL